MSSSKKQQSLLPVYLIVGEDALKREVVIRRLRSRIAQQGDISFNSDDLDASNTTGATIVTSCNTIPFASTVRLVYVRNAEKLKKADTEAVIAYLKTPSPTTVLALEATKLAKNTRLYKAVAAFGKTAVIDCTPPKRYALPKQVRAMANTHGVTFTESAATTLVELVGEDTVHLDNEIKKIALAHRGADAVNANEVMMLTARTTEVKPWEFVDAFAARDLPKCLRYLRQMESTSPHGLIAMCTTRIRELICAKSLVKRGSAAGIPRALNMPDWKVKHHAEWSRRFTEEELIAALTLTRDTEMAMKTGSDPAQTFEDWVITILRQKR